MLSKVLPPSPGPMLLDKWNRRNLSQASNTQWYKHVMSWEGRLCRYWNYVLVAVAWIKQSFLTSKTHVVWTGLESHAIILLRGKSLSQSAAAAALGQSPKSRLDPPNLDSQQQEAGNIALNCFSSQDRDRMTDSRKFLCCQPPLYGPDSRTWYPTWGGWELESPPFLVVYFLGSVPKRCESIHPSSIACSFIPTYHSTFIVRIHPSLYHEKYMIDVQRKGTNCLYSRIPENKVNFNAALVWPWLCQGWVEHEMLTKLFKWCRRHFIWYFAQAVCKLLQGFK